MKVEVLPYDPQWPQDFEAVKHVLLDALAEVDIIGIEHVGSTSVPGLAAKPIIDVDVIVTADNVEPAVNALAAIGYEPRGDLGVPDRYAFFAPDDGPKRNVYVVVEGCVSLRNHLGVRDVLRNNDELRDLYGTHKLELAHNEYEDIGGYVTDKSDVLQMVLAEAGLKTEELAAIKDVNDGTTEPPQTTTNKA